MLGTQVHKAMSCFHWGLGVGGGVGGVWVHTQGLMLEQQGLLLAEPHPHTLLHILDLSSSFNKDEKKWSEVTKLDTWRSFMQELNHPLDMCGQLTSQMSRWREQAGWSSVRRRKAGGAGENSTV